MHFTPEQSRAIAASGNTLLVAGAGAGKTNTLVERCARAILDRTVSIREILVVTFTEAAAAEVRHRLQKRLEQELEQNPANDHLRQELAWMDIAYISTLHSFCYRLIREHFYQLDLDPALRVLDDQQESLLFAQVMDEFFQDHYAGKYPNSAQVQQYILEYHQGRDRSVRHLIREIHHFTQTRPAPGKWFAQQLALLCQEEPIHWQAGLHDLFRDWSNWWLPVLHAQCAENLNAHACAEILKKAQAGDWMGTVREILAQNASWPTRRKSEFRDPIKKLFEEAEILAGFVAPGMSPGKSALQEDWKWFVPPTRLLLDLTQQFEERFGAAKRDRGLIDFHDLEQFALLLLHNEKDDSPTALARHWQERLKLIFVDEYQDINQAQDTILRMLSHSEKGNRFLVGDVKQSIYRFRQADPSIFRKYLHSQGWDRIPLNENFRSHEAILQFVNSLFPHLMRRELGGLEYGTDEALKFGERPTVPELRATEANPNHVEIHLIIADKHDAQATAEGQKSHTDENPIIEMQKAEREAYLLGLRLKELKGTYRFYDEKQKTWLTAEYKHMVVLLRALSSKAEAFARAFAKLDIPLQARRKSFYSTPEIFDLINLLTILDNPLQDIPLLSVLHSPLVGLDFDQLATIRLANPKAPFWHAVARFLQLKNESPETHSSLELFISRYKRWRNEGLHRSLSQRLEAILAETHYDSWILAQPRGQQRYANIQQLLRIARQFDDLRGEGLYQFLLHLQELQDAAGDIEPAPHPADDAVRLMTVHQSKGLEFPIVVVADTGKSVNDADAKAATILDPDLGLCSKIKPPGIGSRYPSLPLWLAQRRARFESIAEEVRILYVALTRARNLLLISGTVSRNRLDKWAQPVPPALLPFNILAANSWFLWIASCLALEHPAWFNADSGQAKWCSWKCHTTVPVASEETPRSQVNQEELTNILQRWEALSLNYPFSTATVQPAKNSVTALRRELNEQLADEAAPLIYGAAQKAGIERGLAHHTFLEHLDLSGDLSPSGLRAQAERLETAQVLPPSEKDLLNFESLAAFWSSPLGTTFLEHRDLLQRELPFTLRLDKEDIAKISNTWAPSLQDEDFIVLQGIVDLALFLPGEILLLDFKTDAVQAESLHSYTEKYRIQLQLYALALEGIYRRPVTKKYLHFFVPGQTVEL